MTIEIHLTGSISGSSAGGRIIGTGIAPVNRERNTAATVTIGSGTTPAAEVERKSIPSVQFGPGSGRGRVAQENVARLNEYVQNIRRRLEFRVDESTKRTVVTVIDHDTQEVIRQIPTETALKMAQRLSMMNEHAGLLFEDRV